jgi:transposase
MRPLVVVGPLGEALTIATLPPANKNLYWVARRKAQVVAAVSGGLLTIEEACERYGISLEEFASWSHAVARSGVHGLRTTHGKRYRKLWKGQEREAEQLQRITHRSTPIH